MYVVLAMVCTQVIMCYLVKDMSWTALILLAYLFGGTINHSLTLAIHDISHNTAFGLVSSNCFYFLNIYNVLFSCCLKCLVYTTKAPGIITKVYNKYYINIGTKINRCFIIDQRKINLLFYVKQNKQTFA